jgi:2-polyprenyl-6-methoxyphenol hydroxylase-like FAD-dependent oxidoreductase
VAGDAAHCASPLSGQGSSLALVGAYILALELGRTGDHQVALARYEERMRPFAEANQALATSARMENLEEMDPAAITNAVDAVKNAIDLEAIVD